MTTPFASLLAAAKASETETPAWLAAVLADEVRADPRTLTALIGANAGFANPFKADDAPLASDEQHRIETLTWAMAALRNWHPHQDRDGRRLTIALMICLVATPVEGEAWQELWQAIAPGKALIEGLALIIGSREIAVEPQTDAPEWELAALRRLRGAEAAGDWPAMIEGFGAFSPPPLDPELCAAVRALFHLAPARLSLIGEARSDIFNVAVLLHALPLVDALAIARRAVDPRLKVEAMHGAASARVLTGGEAAELQALLVEVSTDRRLWPALMRIFNQYPVRYPSLQRPLGHALAGAPREALTEYVSAIELALSASECAVQVADCLEAFRKSAPADRRNVLWESAWNRWIAWDFAAAPGSHLSGVVRTALDYALTGYLLEVAPAGAAEEGLQGCLERMTRLGRDWYASKSDLNSDYRRILSRLQVYAHVRSGDLRDVDWLPDAKIYGLSDDPWVAAHVAEGPWPAPRR